jgi:hypothetical protein
MHICNWVFCGFDGVHGESRYMLRKHADDTTSLSMLVRVIGAIGNYGKKSKTHLNFKPSNN